MGITLPILRRTGELGEFGVVSGADCPLLGLGITTALTKRASLCRPAGSTFHTLAASSQGGAFLPGAALCRDRKSRRVGSDWSSDVCSSDLLRRRSQNGQVSAVRLGRLFTRWLPRPRVVHSYPEQRFAEIGRAVV